MSSQGRSRRLMPFLWIALTASACLSFACLDGPVSSWVRQHKFTPTIKAALRVVRLPGSFPFTVVVMIAIALVLRRRLRDVIAPLAVCAIASASAGVLKIVFGRHRPSAGDGPLAWIAFGARVRGDFVPANLSFPSGDATLAFATATVLTALCPRGGPLAFGFAAATAAARVLQGVHYPSDVLAGALVGTLTADLAMRLARRIKIAAQVDPHARRARHRRQRRADRVVERDRIAQFAGGSGILDEQREALAVWLDIDRQRALRVAGRGQFDRLGRSRCRDAVERRAEQRARRLARQRRGHSAGHAPRAEDVPCRPAGADDAQRRVGDDDPVAHPLQQQPGIDRPRVGNGMRRAQRIHDVDRRQHQARTATVEHVHRRTRRALLPDAEPADEFGRRDEVAVAPLRRLRRINMRVHG